MAIHFGNDKIKEVYFIDGGVSQKIKEIYNGSQLLYSSFMPSYAILTDDSRIDFELENTPLANFCTTGDAPSTSIIVNGQSVIKRSVKELYFGSSYRATTGLPSNFCIAFRSLVSVDLSIFINITNIDSSFMRTCDSLVSLDLSKSVNLTSIGDRLLQNSGTTTLTMGATNAPTLGSSWVFSGTPLVNIYVPYGSENAYKTAPVWSTKSGIIQGDPSSDPASHVTLIDDSMIYFNSGNTPIENFCTSGDETSSITLGGINVAKNSIKEIYFSEMYNKVVHISDYFLTYFTNLVSVNLNSLRNVLSVGAAMLQGSTSIDIVDLSSWTYLGSMWGGFLRDSAATTLLIGTATPPSLLGAQHFEDASALSLILVPCGSENAYKSATGWIDKASIIHGDC